MKSVGLVWFLTSHLLGNVTLVSFGAEWGTLLAQNHKQRRWELGKTFGGV